MIHDYICGSDVAEKTGWNEDTMLRLFSNFISSNDLEDKFLDYLNNLADMESGEF